MRIYYDLENIEFNNPVVTVGTFDGLHKGHLKVLKELKTIAKKSNVETVVFTFWPHPRLVLNNSKQKILLINTLDEKIKRFNELGIDNLIIYPFTLEFSKFNYIDFIKQIIVDKLNTRQLIIGYDHKFGNDREGSFEKLIVFSEKLNFEVKKINALGFENINISSTKIRNAILEGNLEVARKYLDYDYMFSGTVVEGKRLGNKIGYPTANIHLNDDFKLIPEQGVFAVNIIIDNIQYDGMLNIGFNPTVSKNRNKKIEVNIFDFNKNIYKKSIEIILRYKLRNEIKFSSIEKMIEQLQIDKKNTLKLLT